MTNWHFFQTLLGQLVALIQTGGDALLNGALTYARPLLLAAIPAWIAFRSIMAAKNFCKFNDVYRDIVRAAVVVFLLQSVATYNQYVGDLAMAIPTEVGHALAAAGSANGNVANGAAFDDVWNAAAKAGIAVFEHIPKYSLSSIPLWFAVIVFLAIALIAIGASFLLYLASTIFLLMLLKTGPLFVVLFAFPITAKFGSGWVAAVVSTILTQIFTVAILIMFIGTEQATVVRITQGVTGGVLANFIDEIVTLGEAALLMWLISTLVKQAPAFAGSIAHGVFQNVNGMIGTAANVAGSGIKNTIGGIALAGRGVSAGVQKTASVARVSRPTGRSISGSS